MGDGDSLPIGSNERLLHEADDELLFPPRGERQQPAVEIEFDELGLLRESLGRFQDEANVWLVADFIRRRMDKIRGTFLSGDFRTALHLSRHHDALVALVRLIGERDAFTLVRVLWRLSQRFSQRFVPRRPLIAAVPTSGPRAPGDPDVELTGYGAFVVRRALHTLRGVRYVDFGRMNDRSRVARQLGLTAPFQGPQDRREAEYRRRARRVIGAFLGRLIVGVEAQGDPSLLKRLLIVYAITGDMRAWQNAAFNAFSRIAQGNHEKARGLTLECLEGVLRDDPAFDFARDAADRDNRALASLSDKRCFRDKESQKLLRQAAELVAVEARAQAWMNRPALIAERVLGSMERPEGQRRSDGSRIGPRTPYSPFGDELRYILIADPTPEIITFLWDGK